MAKCFGAVRHRAQHNLGSAQHFLAVAGEQEHPRQVQADGLVLRRSGYSGTQNFDYGIAHVGSFPGLPRLLHQRRFGPAA